MQCMLHFLINFKSTLVFSMSLKMPRMLLTSLDMLWRPNHEIYTVNYLKMHDIEMHKSNYAYGLDGNQLGEQ